MVELLLFNYRIHSNKMASASIEHFIQKNKNVRSEKYEFKNRVNTCIKHLFRDHKSIQLFSFQDFHYIVKHWKF